MIQTNPYVNFASGELSPNVWGRTDRPFYATGLEIMRNFLPLLTGPATYRPGLVYINHTRLNQKAFVLPFQFNDEQAYDLSFTDKKMRVTKDGGVVLEVAKTVTGITQANPGVVTVASHGFANGDEVYFSGIGGMTEVNGQFYLVANVTTNTFTLTDIDGVAINTTGFTAFSSSGLVARVYEIDTPYIQAHLWQLKIAQRADLAYLTHPAYDPRKLTRTGHASWTLSRYYRTIIAKTITAVTNASPGVITATAHGFVSGDRVLIRGIAGVTELNDTVYKVVYIGADTFSLQTLAGSAVDTTNYAAYDSGGEVAKIASSIKKTITGITKASPGVVTATAHGFVTGDKVYIFDVAGMTQVNENFYWVNRVDANNVQLIDDTGAYIDTTSFTTYSSGGYIAKAVGKFMAIGEFPAACGFYGGRFWMGGSDEDPDVFDGSRGASPTTGASRFDDFTVGTNAADSVSFTLASQNGTADRIRWFSGTPKFLVIGTFGSLYRANGGSDYAAITPTAISVVPISSYGVSDQNPIFVGTGVVYVENGNRTLRSFEYSFVDDSYTALDKNLLSDEITASGIVQICFTQGRPDIIWAVLGNGDLLSCTFLSKEEVAGWARHKIGGNGKVISIAPDYRDNNFDRLVACVERTIGGKTRRYLEYIELDLQTDDPLDHYTGAENKTADESKYRNLAFEIQKTFIRMDSAVVLDTTQNVTLTLSALTGTNVTATAGSALFTATDVGKFIFIKYLDGTETGVGQIIEYTSSTVVKIQTFQDFSTLSIPTGGWYLMTSTVRGLGHLEGAEVSIVTDGGVHINKTVANGMITLDYPARYVIVGFAYLGFGRSLDLEFGSQTASTQGRLRNIHKLIFKFRNTMGGKYGTSSRKLYAVQKIPYRRANVDYTDRPPLLFSGVRELTNFDDWNLEKKFYFVQDEPLPMTVQIVIPVMDTTVE